MVNTDSKDTKNIIGFFGYMSQHNTTIMQIKKRKDSIPTSVKHQVWQKYRLYSLHEDITRCCTCTNLVLMPNSISSNSDIKQIYVNGVRQTISGVAEYGHIVAEHNGGKATGDNLLIQCKSCNVRQKTNNIENHQLVYDCDMLDVDINDDVEMGENFHTCQGVCSSGHKCKNKTIFNRKFCHIHLLS